MTNDFTEPQALSAQVTYQHCANTKKENNLPLIQEKEVVSIANNIIVCIMARPLLILVSIVRHLILIQQLPAP